MRKNVVQIKIEKTDYIRTYFPINLSQQEVVDMINEAYENKIKVPETKNLYLGMTNEGMFIYMYLTEYENRKCISAI